MSETATSGAEFVLIAESGVLELQALLLCESLRRFAGIHARSPITVVSPRRERRPSPATIRALGRLDVEYLPLEIDSCCPDYGTSFRVHAAAHVERRPGPPTVVQLDSDTIFLAEPDLALTGSDAAARPVDVKGMCTTGADDPFDPWWRRLCALVGVDYERVPTTTTTVDRQTIRASYNGGFVAVRRACGLFGRTEEAFRRLVAAGLTPWPGDGPTVQTGTGVVRGAATAWWGTSQAAFSLAAVAGGHAVRLMRESHNFPLHLVAEMSTPIPRPLVHLHYHWLFTAGEADAIRIAFDKLELPEDVAEWLATRLPLDPASAATWSARVGQPRIGPGEGSQMRKPAMAHRARSTTPARRRAILVLGMHRSGTSALAGAVSAMGAASPKNLLPGNAANPRGYFESRPLLAAHDDMLAAAGSSWDDWRQIDPRWMLSQASRQHRSRVRAVLTDEFGEAPLFVVKDPRICRFVPMASSILAEMEAAPVAFLLMRNPLEVAHSLHRRSGLAPAKSLLAWLRHMLDAEYHSRDMPRCFLRYPDFLADGRSHLDRAASATSISWPARIGADVPIEQFLTMDLYHERSTLADLRAHAEIGALVHNTYEILLEIAANGERPALLDRLDLLRTEFDVACDLFGLLVAADEGVIEQSRREVAEVTADRDRLARAIDDLGRERDELVREHDRAAHERDRAINERDGAAGERDALRASTSWRLTEPLRMASRLLRRTPAAEKE
jgi:hypothetical protein